MPRDNLSFSTGSFPPFTGVVRQLVLANGAIFLIIVLLSMVEPHLLDLLGPYLQLHPVAVVHGEIWQLATYSFIDARPIDVLCAMLSLWLCGSAVESFYGGRWFTELYFTSAIGGALLASVLSFTHVLHLSPNVFAGGAWAGVFGILIAIAMRLGDQEFLGIRIKYVVAIYIAISVGLLLKSGDVFGALLQLSGALCGFLYVDYAPRKGLAFVFSEQFFGLRNAYYRSKRRRAARKFEVYMGKQGRTVNFDKEGRYVDPDEKKDPNDKRWMN